MTGIDVSKHQGVIDWQKVKAEGIKFAIIRAGYGMYENQVDSRFMENMAGAKAAGIPVRSPLLPKNPDVRKPHPPI